MLKKVVMSGNNISTVTQGKTYQASLSEGSTSYTFWDDTGVLRYLNAYKWVDHSDEHISQDDTPIDDGQNRDLSKYDRLIKPGVTVDVYDVLTAFEISCPALAHALKKLLAAGSRGVKSAVQDKEEAIASIKRSIELEHDVQA